MKVRCAIAQLLGLPLPQVVLCWRFVLPMCCTPIVTQLVEHSCMPREQGIAGSNQFGVSFTRGSGYNTNYNVLTRIQICGVPECMKIEICRTSSGHPMSYHDV